MSGEIILRILVFAVLLFQLGYFTGKIVGFKTADKRHKEVERIIRENFRGKLK